MRQTLRTVGIPLLLLSWFTGPAALGQVSDEQIRVLQDRARAENWPFTVGHTSASHRPVRELCGYKSGPEEIIPPVKVEAGGATDPNDLPTQFDWRNNDGFNGLTPIRNQDGCGSCWAFATVGVVEAMIKIYELVEVDISEQWVVSCGRFGTCNGGNAAFSHFLPSTNSGAVKDKCDATGAVMEVHFPYQAADVACQCPYMRNYWIDGVYSVGSGNIAAIKKAIKNYGPVYVTCAAGYPEFSSYTGGVYIHDDVNDPRPTDHAVVLVGWNDNMSGHGVWIMRNSWDTGWGENGYMYIKWGTSNIAAGGGIYLEYYKAPVIEHVADRDVLLGYPYTHQLHLDQGTAPVTWSLVTGPPGMTVGEYSGVVEWSPDPNYSPATVSVRAANKMQGLPVTWTVTVKIAPVVDPISDQTITMDTPYSYQPNLATGSLPVTWSLRKGPPGMTIDPNNGKVTWEHPKDVCTSLTDPNDPNVLSVSPHTITVMAQNSVDSVQRSWKLTVSAPPIITAVGDRSIPVGQPYRQVLTLTQGSSPVKWELVSPPSGVNIDEATGEVTWANPSVPGSSYIINVKASNTVGSDQETWTLTVKALPTIKAIDDQKITAGQPYTQIPELTAGGPDANWTLRQGPSGMSINASTGAVTWSSPSTGGSPFTIEIRATTDVGEASESWHLAVVAVPVIAPIPDANIPLGSSFTLAPSVNTESLPVKWTFKSGAPSDMTLDPNTGMIQWTNASPADTTYTITVAARNDAGEAQDTFQISVYSVPGPPVVGAIPNRNATAGQTYTETPIITQGTVPVTWSLETFPEGMTIDSSTGKITWPQPGPNGSTQTVKVRATNTIGYSEATWQIAIVLPSGPPVIQPIADKTILAGTAYTETPTLTRGTSPFTWSLITSPTGMTINSTSGVVTWSNPTTTGSPFIVAIRARNSAGSADASWQLTVNAPPSSPTISTIADQTIREGSAYPTTTIRLTRGTQPVTWSMVSGPSGMTIDASTGVVTWPTVTGNGSPFTARVRAENAVGADEKGWLVTVKPAMVEVSVGVEPNNVALQLTVDGKTFGGIQKFNWEAGTGHQLSVISPQRGTDMATYTLRQWSDGEASAARTIVVSTDVKSYFAQMSGVSITGLTISGPERVAEKTTTPYKAILKKSDGTNEDVTAVVRWWLSSSSWPAVISSDGLFSTMDVAGASYAEIYASYERDGIALSGRLPVSIYAVPKTFVLTLATSPASGEPKTSTHTEGDVVSVQVPAAPQEGMVFVGWSGDAGGTSNPLVLTMNGNKVITAVFQAGSTTQPSPNTPSFAFCGIGVPSAAMACGVGLLMMTLVSRRRNGSR